MLTCYNKVTTNAHTSQAISGRGKVSSRGPCGGASGPGLGGGEEVSHKSSADDVHLNQNVIILKML